jgi:hypothetical protein
LSTEGSPETEGTSREEATKEGAAQQRSDESSDGKEDPNHSLEDIVLG